MASNRNQNQYGDFSAGNPYATDNPYGADEGNPYAASEASYEMRNLHNAPSRSGVSATSSNNPPPPPQSNRRNNNNIISNNNNNNNTNVNSSLNNYNMSQPNGVSRTNVPNGASFPPPQSIAGNAGTSGADMNAFFDEVDDIRNRINDFEKHIAEVESLHTKSLNEIDEEQDNVIQRKLDAESAETSRIASDLKLKIKSLESRSQRDSTKSSQASTLKKQFMDAIQHYQTVEAQFRSKYKQRAERQYRIVRPDATDAEVEAAVEDADGGQIFSQALLASNRRGEARTALSEVQARHRDIQRIEKTMGELATLFRDMEVMVAENDEAVTHIDERANAVQHDIEQGVAETDKAVQHARAARKKKWICIGILIAICIIIVVVIVAAYFGSR